MAPGVRVRVSSRGVRASVGPRGARVHVGGGRTGVSTGVGPVTLYSGLGSSRTGGRSRSTASSSAATYRRQLAAAQRSARLEEQAAAARQAQAALLELTSAHLTAFVPAQRPLAPDPFNLDEAAVAEHFRQAHLSGVSRLDRAARRAGTAAADLQTREYLAHARANAGAHRSHMQAALDGEWQLLVGGDPGKVLEVVADALADNGAVATPVDSNGTAISIVMIAPPESDLPDVRPHQNASGAWTTKKMTAAERNELYLDILCSHVLTTVKETFAVAPSLVETAIAVVRDEAPMGMPDWKVLCVVETDRQRIGHLGTEVAAPAHHLLNALADVEIRFRSNSVKILPLNPRQSGAAADILERLDRDDSEDGATDPAPEDLSAATPASPPPEGSWPETVGAPAPLSPPAPMVAPPGWQPDPWRQAELRWWDGQEWTSHVSTRQQP